MINKVYIVPRWSGTAHSDWYDWFKEEVEKQYDCEVVALTMPHWNNPTIATATAFLLREIPAPDASTLLIGHSVGCLAALHYLERLLTPNANLSIGGLLLVAGWFDVDETWGTILPWLENDHLNYSLVRNSIEQKRVIVSDNDPFTSNYEANARLWRDRLGADVTICPGKSHFNSKVEPDVLAEFREMMSRYAV